ncbi:sugar transferase [Paracrocinitomix mangrovi]|uniref:sugar transferase n=1 Tax=Paracrocinitomix mangrovi TaxID=2862509 RepID=UPI001C8D2881|nr:sugar transferase [Paracrocinitomix mangrovi]UKN02059.1 sugar transferase [Paracrocinitomix mangrovi]
MTSRQKAILFLIVDFITAAIVWFLFYIYRIKTVEHTEVVFKGNFYTGLIALPFFWILLYTIQGTYHNIKENYRLKTIKHTLYGTLMGCILIFFAFVLNDYVSVYTQFYTLLLVFIGLHFTITLIPRFIFTTIYVKRIHKGIIGFDTIIIGGSNRALEVLEDINSLKQKSGYNFIGYVNINGTDTLLSDKLPYLGHIDNIHDILKNNKVERAIIALESSDHERLKGIITELAPYDIKISTIPDAYDILAGQLKMNSIFGALLLDVTPSIMPDWQFSTKRLIDIGVSLIALIVLIPFYITVGIIVKTTSKGPVFFTQERIGKHGKKFNIIKFRTMVQNAEKNGPQLSSSEDKRITGIGKFLRKTRFDEFPQFWNVLIGDMSLVGPRPERQYYIDKIAAKDPQYLYLHKVRPGITSWGQVKFGYAENVEQMVQRMKYDLLYIRNMSLALDFKIMFYTIAIIFKGAGK